METLKLDLTGQLLLAMPGLGDTRFRNAVVYICHHDADGAMGLIVNKPIDDLSLADVMDRLGIEHSDAMRECKVHYGGPVETQRGFVLHSLDFAGPGRTLKIGEKYGVTASVEILEDMAEGTGPEIALLALGYSGWGPGQLEEELSGNFWLTLDAGEGFIFRGSDAPEIWTETLRAAGIEPINLSGVSGRA